MVVSKETIAKASEEQLERYKAMDAVSRTILMDRPVLTNPSQAGTAGNRTSEQLKVDLDTEKNNLEMNRGANPGVIAQYEKRKQDVCHQCLYFYPFHDILYRSRLSPQRSVLEKKMLTR